MTTLAIKYQGQWPQLLAALGVEEKFLRNVHGPCPLCGGEDRFRFDNKNGEGTYYCNACGPGDGVKLLAKLKGWDLRQVAHSLERLAGDVPRDFRPAKQELSMAQRRRLLNEAWGAAKYPEVVKHYMESRGLTYVQYRDVRGSKTLRLDDEVVPGVVSLIRAPDGSPISLHRILLPGYLADKKKKKIMPPLHTITGGAIRLDLIQNPVVLHVAEGVESAMAVAQQTPGYTVWATISAHGMETLEVPDSVEALHIWADTDENFVGLAAALQLAKRIKLKRKECMVEVIFGEQPGDALDRLNESGEVRCRTIVI